MFPLLRLGPFLVQLPGLALLAGVWAGLSLAEKQAVRLKLNASDIYHLVFYGLVAGIVGARLAYAARYLNAYLANPISLLALTPTTLWPAAGLVIGLAAGALVGWRKRLPLRPTLDALAPGLAAFLVALGVAHFLSGDAFGASAKLPWSLYLWDDYRHPSQVYEIVAALTILVTIWKRPVGRPGDGTGFLLVVALSAGARIFLEAFRGDSVVWPGGFRAAQIVGLVVLATALWLLKNWGRTSAPEPMSAQETPMTGGRR